MAWIGRQLTILVAGNFFLTLGFSIIMPILPYYSSSLGASALDLGLIMAVYSVMQFIVTPFWGEMSDRIGRKPIFLIGMFGYGLSFLVYGVATQLWMLFFARAMGGLLAGGIYPASLAYIADMTEPVERGRIMGLLGASASLGMIFGPLIAGVLSAGGLTFPFFVTAAAAIAFGVLGYFLLEESRAVSARRLRHRIRLVDPLKTPQGILFLLTLLITFLMSGFQGTIAYYIIGRFGVADAPAPMPLLGGEVIVTGPTLMAVLFTVMGLAGVVCQGVLVGILIRAAGERKTILAGIALGAASFLLLVLSPELVSLMLFASALAVASGLVMPCLNALISRHTDEEHQGAVMGVAGSYGSLGRIAGPPIGGVALDINVSLPYLICGALSAAGAIAFLLSGKRRR